MAFEDLFDLALAVQKGKVSLDDTTSYDVVKRLMDAYSEGRGERIENEIAIEGLLGKASGKTFETIQDIIEMATERPVSNGFAYLSLLGEGKGVPHALKQYAKAMQEVQDLIPKVEFRKHRPPVPDSPLPDTRAWLPDSRTPLPRFDPPDPYVSIRPPPLTTGVQRRNQAIDPRFLGDELLDLTARTRPRTKARNR